MEICPASRQRKTKNNFYKRQQLVEVTRWRVLPGSFREMGAFYFKIENRDIFKLSTILLTRTTAHKQSLTTKV